MKSTKQLTSKRSASPIEPKVNKSLLRQFRFHKKKRSQLQIIQTIIIHIKKELNNSRLMEKHKKRIII
jgi:hypothetical protein